jgi:ketosteroid isomerase-like protein
MSRQYVEIVRRSIEAFNRGDWDAVLREGHPAIEWHVYLSPEGQVARGRAEVLGMWEDRRSVFGGFHWHVDDLVDAGHAVIAVGELRGVAPGGTDREIAAPIAQVYWFEDGLVRVVRSYSSKDEAMAAVELLPAEAPNGEQDP